MENTVLEVKKVSKIFKKYDGFLPAALHRVKLGKKLERLVAVDKVDLTLSKNETLGIVGESGCGKSTLGRMAVNLLKPTEGKIELFGKDIDQVSVKERLKLQMVFQNPDASLDPKQRVGAAIAEAPLVHKLITGGMKNDFVNGLLATVGLKPEMADRFPHELSGGQKQRVGIARALAVNPEVVVFDEAVAALDVSIQAQVLNLLIDLKNNQNFSSLFISHDLNVVRFISDRVAILYLGRVVETAPVDEIFNRGHHPYTKNLLAQAPSLEEKKRVFDPIRGEIPSPLDPPTGCHFHPRCPFAEEKCRTVIPVLREIAPRHQSACHLDSPA